MSPLAPSAPCAPTSPLRIVAVGVMSLPHIEEVFGTVLNLLQVITQPPKQRWRGRCARTPEQPGIRARERRQQVTTSVVAPACTTITCPPHVYASRRACLVPLLRVAYIALVRPQHPHQGRPVHMLYRHIGEGAARAFSPAAVAARHQSSIRGRRRHHGLRSGDSSCSCSCSRSKSSWASSSNPSSGRDLTTPMVLSSGKSCSGAR